MYPYSNGYDVNPLRAAYASPTTQYTAPIRYILNRPNDYRRCISTAESDFFGHEPIAVDGTCQLDENDHYQHCL